jgi:hypothetical protein
VPTVRGLEKEYATKVTFTFVNVLNPKSKTLMEQYSFSTTPEIYLVQGGNEVIAFWDEEVPIETLRQALDVALELGN